MKIFLILFAIFLILPLFVIRPILLRVANKLIAPGVIGFDGRGFFLPLLLFHARNVRFFLKGSRRRDRVFFSADEVRFRVHPLFLLLGRVRLIHLVLKNPFLEYINRQESFEKNRLLPGRHRIEVKGGTVIGGAVSVVDETMPQAYRIELKNIQLYNGDMDLSTPVDVLFRSERGEADIASGRLMIGRSGSIGFLRLWGVTWGEITNIGDVPFLRGKVALEALHTGGSDRRQVEGFVGSLKRDEDDPLHPGIDETSNPVAFAFPIEWNDYRVTFDLGLQKLIGSILKHSKGTVLTSGFLLGGRGVFEMLKKPESGPDAAKQTAR